MLSATISSDFQTPSRINMSHEPLTGYLRCLLKVVLIWVLASFVHPTAGLDQKPLLVGRKFPDLYEASIAELQTGLERGDFTSVDLVKVGVFRPEILGYSEPVSEPIS